MPLSSQMSVETKKKTQIVRFRRIIRSPESSISRRLWFLSWNDRQLHHRKITSSKHFKNTKVNGVTWGVWLFSLSQHNTNDYDTTCFRRHRRLLLLLVLPFFVTLAFLFAKCKFSWTKKKKLSIGIRFISIFFFLNSSVVYLWRIKFETL